jgi:hypothetical protein
MLSVISISAVQALPAGQQLAALLSGQCMRANAAQ